MALDEYDEHEQSERVREWLRRNLGSIVIGILVGVGGIVGWHQWQARSAAHAEQAQERYLRLLAAVNAADDAGASGISDELRKDYGDTAYAVLAAFRNARTAVERGDLSAARQQLEWARASASDPELRQLAMLRLARVTLALGEPAAALALADGVSSRGYAALREELRGDALAALGRNDEARAAYDAALAGLDAGAAQREFVQMKRDNVGVALAAASAPPAGEAAAPAAAAAAPTPNGG